MLCRDHGAAGLVTLFAAVLILVVATAGITAAGDLSVTAARARAAADAAALAGMATSPLVGFGDVQAADDAAGRVAEANRGRLIGTRTSAWPLRYGVTVEMDPLTSWVRRFVGPVRAKAAAGVRPRLHR